MTMAAARVAQRGQVVGPDLSAPMLARARAKAAVAGLTDVEFVCGDGAHWLVTASRPSAPSTGRVVTGRPLPTVADPRRRRPPIYRDSTSAVATADSLWPHLDASSAGKGRRREWER